MASPLFINSNEANGDEFDPFGEAPPNLPTTPVRRPSNASKPANATATTTTSTDTNTTRTTPSTDTTTDSPTSTSRRRCAVPGCYNDVTSFGFCGKHTALHSATPSSRVRTTLKLWEKHVLPVPSAIKTVWTFYYLGESYSVELVEAIAEHDLSLSVGGRPIDHSDGSRDFDFSLGTAEAFACKVAILMDENMTLSYDLWIDGLSWSTRRERYKEQMEAQTAKEAEQYINQNWDREDTKEKTSFGYKKSRIAWHFTINGTKYHVVLEHGHTGGKRKLWVNGEVVFERKLGLLESNTNADLTFRLEAETVPCVVVIEKNTDSASKKNRPFLYDLFIDNISFSEVTNMAIDVDKERALQLKAKRLARIQKEREKDAERKESKDAPSGAHNAEVALANARRQSIYTSSIDAPTDTSTTNADADDFDPFR